MIDDRRGIERALRGTLLAGLPVEQVAGRSFRIHGIAPGDVLPAWRAARGLLPVTGRYPVFLSDDFGRLGPLLGGVVPEPDADRLVALDRAVRAEDPWTATGAWPDEPLEVDDLCLYVPEFDGADLLDEAEATLSAPTMWSVDRWVYDRVRGDPDLLCQAERRTDYLVGTSYWFTPASVELWLLPVDQSHLAAAMWVDYFPLVGRPEALGAALWRWHEAHGAGLVASWGTMLQFVATRRPAPGDEAWELARQHKEFASHLEPAGWEMALTLARSDEWFLHSRP